MTSASPSNLSSLSQMSSSPTSPTIAEDLPFPDDYSTCSSHDSHQAPKKSNTSGSQLPTDLDPEITKKHQRRKSRRKSISTGTDSRIGLAELSNSGTFSNQRTLNPNLVHIELPIGKPIHDVYDGVHDGRILGSGISGVVRLVKHRMTGVEYAVKVLELKGVVDQEEGMKQLKEEIYIMCQLDHPNIVRLEEVYESHDEIYLVQEVCRGGELFDRLDEQPDYHYTERQCAALVKQMLGAVRYIHLKGIIHRDLKLENFLFSSREGEGSKELKMMDFGLSKHFTMGEVHHEAVGTPYTVAPEVIGGSYDEKCDVWAIGVITYLLLSGDPPFGGCGGPETLGQVRENILRGAYDLEENSEIWQNVSPEAKDFIRSLLVVNPMARPTARQAKESKWLQMWENSGNGVDSMINPNVVKALVGFKEYSDMKKLLCEVLSFTLLPEQIHGLRKEFEKYDQDGTGEITLSTLKKVLIGNASTGSLGGLTEEEVVDIFNAMRVRKGESSVHWHDFIAAGLSQCQVDDRNLRLAFERLDQEHNGYITFENVMDLVGEGSFENEDEMLKIWGESMNDANLRFIDYENFVHLMKGMTREESESMLGLAAVPETTFEEEENEQCNSVVSKGSYPELLPLGVAMTKTTALGKSELNLKGLLSTALRKSELNLKGLNTTALGKSELNLKGLLSTALRKSELNLNGLLSPDHLVVAAKMSPSPSKAFVRMGSNSFGDCFEEIEEEDCPPSMDDDVVGSGGGGRSVLTNEQVGFEAPDLGNLTHPQTPARGPADCFMPMSAVKATSRIDRQLTPRSSSTPPDLPKSPRSSLLLSIITRGRSVSFDVKDASSSSDTPVIEGKLIEDRPLNRTHHELRHSVSEACDKFEDEQMRRAKEELRTLRTSTAGLVMRHGQDMSGQSIKNFLKKTLEEQQKKVDKANRRGGRGRRGRRRLSKTISDLSGMVGGPEVIPHEGSPKLTASFTGAGDVLLEGLKSSFTGAGDVLLEGSTTPTASFTGAGDVPKEEALAPANESDKSLRYPTKPGDFRKTNYDPFRRKPVGMPLVTIMQ